MTVRAQQVLREFEELPPEEQKSVGHEVLRRLLGSAFDEFLREGLRLAFAKPQEPPIPPSVTPPAPEARTLGPLRGRFKVPDDFDAPLPDELLRAFEGEQ